VVAKLRDALGHLELRMRHVKGRFRAQKHVKGRFRAKEHVKGRFRAQKHVKGRFRAKEHVKGRYKAQRWTCTTRALHYVHGAPPSN